MGHCIFDLILTKKTVLRNYGYIELI